MLFQYKDSTLGFNLSSNKIYVADLTLAYETLINPESREEYDLYLHSSGKSSTQNYWNWEPGSTPDAEKNKTKKREYKSTFRYAQYTPPDGHQRASTLDLNGSPITCNLKITFDESV